MGSIGSTLDQHVEGGSMSWLLRDRAVAEPHYSLRDLSERDDILDAHLLGIQSAGESGWNLAIGKNQWDDGGDVFVAAVLALSVSDNEKIELVLDAIDESLDLQRPIVSALAWLPWKRVESIAAKLATSPSAFRRCIGIGAFELHRRDPGERLLEWLQDEDPNVISRAVQYVVAVGRSDLFDHVAELYSETSTLLNRCLLYTSPSPRDATLSRMPSSA